MNYTAACLSFFLAEHSGHKKVIQNNIINKTGIR
jgi:hypothetical protein